MSKPFIHKKDTELRFGKYKGQTVGDVLSFDPSYLVWAYKNISWFHIEKSVFDKAVDDSVEQAFQRTIRRHVSMYWEDSPYWFEDDNGSW